MGREESGLVKGVGWGFLVALGFVPLIYGANVPLAWGLNGFVFGLLLTAYVGALSIERRPLPVRLSRLTAPLLAFGAVMVWIFVQAQSWTPSFLHNPAWARASELLQHEVPGAISVNPGESLLGLLRLATALIVFLMAMQIGRDPKWALRIIGAIAVAGAIQAVYALVLAAVGPVNAGMILPASLFKLEQGGQAHFSGTFINRNHLAIYLALAIVAAWGLFFRDMRAGFINHGYHGRRETVAKGLHLAMQVGRYSLLFFPLLAGLLLTTSRAGIFLTMAAVILIVVLERLRARSGSRTSRIATNAALVVACLGAVLALTARGDLVGQRLAGANLESDVGGRLAVAVITLRAIADYPLVGWGYGTFHNVFPVYRDDTIPISTGRWMEAHNSYLEAVLGLGIPGAVLLWFAIGWVVLACLRGSLKRKRDQLAPQVATAAVFIVGLHVLVDFSIQLQGISLPFAALLGAGYAQSWSSRSA